jgi:hypothetical protein
MSESYARFLALSHQDRKDVFEAAADRLDTLPSYVEKDFWVCFVLDALYNRLPDGHPQLLFKGGTALSKAFGLIRPLLGGHRSRRLSRRARLRGRSRPDKALKASPERSAKRCSTS